MKFLCLAYGAEQDWKMLPKPEQDGLLEQDATLRANGALMGGVNTQVTTVRAWEGRPTTSPEPLAALKIPLAGFSIIEAESLDAVVEMVSRTPCARAVGAIEVRPITFLNEEQWKSMNR